jgi:hypothetical protein
VAINVDVRVGVWVAVFEDVDDGFNVQVGRGVNVIVLVLEGVKLGEVVNEGMSVITEVVGLEDGVRI